MQKFLRYQIQYHKNRVKFFSDIRLIFLFKTEEK